MISMADIQETVAEALEASTVLSGVSAIIDDGTKDAEIEEELRDPGTVIIIPPFLGAVPRSQAGGRAILDVQFMVLLCINPKVNGDQDTPKETIECLEAVIDAVLGIAPTADTDRFALEDPALELNTFDQGLVVFNVFFRKGAAI